MKYRTAKFANDAPITKWPCPYCGSPNDSAAEVGGRTVEPKPEDLFVCYHCGGFCELDELLLPVKLSKEKFDALPESHQAVLQLAGAAAKVREIINLPLKGKTNATDKNSK